MKTKFLDIKIFNCKICFILIISISFCNNFVVFPIKIKNDLKQIDDNINTAKDYKDYINNNKISVYIPMGTPSKKIEIYLTSERVDFIFGEGFCTLNGESDYNTSLSETFIKSKISFSSPIYTNGFLCNENIVLYTNFNFSKNISFQNLDFIKCNPSPDIFDIVNNNSFCGYMGMQISSSSDYFEWHSIFYQLKSERYIIGPKWSLIFNKNIINNHDGALIIGINDEEYKNIFNYGISLNSEFSTIYSLKTFSNSDYEIKFDELYYNINTKNYTFNKFIQGIFIIDYDYIISNDEYFNSIKNTFFSQYITQGTCFIDKSNKYRKTKKKDMQLLNIIFCNKNKIGINEIKNFPTLFFKHVNLNQIFEFNYEDLFQETKNFYVFKIMLDENNKRFWNFGRTFLKKYQFIFDNDQKTLTYIGINTLTPNQKANDDIKKNNTNFFSNKLYLIFILAFIIIIIAVLIGLFLGKKIFNKNKKKRANELDDDYEYIEKKINPNEGIGIKFNDNE